MPKRSKELIDLWIAVAIMLLLSVYHLLVTFSHTLSVIFHVPENFPGKELLSHGIYAWLLGLLYIAYQRWRKVVERETELTVIMESTGPAVVLVATPKRKITSCNGSVGQVFGYQPNEVEGKTTDFLYNDRRPSLEYPEEIYETLKQVGFHIGEASGRHKEGREIDLEIITVEKKTESGVVLLVKDITARKEAEKRILAAKEQAEHAMKEKQQFAEELEQNYVRLKELESSRDTLTHMIVHDMKTPLSVLSLNAEILRQMAGQKLNAEEMKSIDDISSYCTQLDIMMKSMLDTSRMEEGELPLSKHPHSIEPTVEKAVDMLGTIKGDHNIEILKTRSLPSVSYDDELIQRVLMNLLVNAIKYSKSNSRILVELSTTPDAVKVSVSDQGAGIPKSRIHSIFDKFSQVNDHGHRYTGSTGLGLTFCRLAVEAHNGQIGVNSEEGMGSTFWFTLPLEAVPASTPSLT